MNNIEIRTFHQPTRAAILAALDAEPYRGVFGDELTYQIGNRPLNDAERSMLADNLATTLEALGYRIRRVASDTTKEQT